MSLKGLIFDFDGLILDTEMPIFTAWQEVFSSFNQVLPVNIYAQCLGSSEDAFHPLDFLETSLGTSVNREELLFVHRKREQELLSRQQVLPGVRETILEAKRMGLQVAIASSSDRKWVTGNLDRIGLLKEFALILTSDEVHPVKPAPDLFLAALVAMGITPREAIVLEDSPNGITAAKAAGIFVIAIPNPVSAQLNITHADLILQSMSDLELQHMIQQFHSPIVKK